MEEFDFIDSIKIRALRASWKPDYEALLRRVFRWYSEKYHTPLHQVEDLPLEDVLQTWFEIQYDSMDPEDRHNLAIFLLEDDQERRNRDATDKKADEEFFLMTKQRAASQKKQKDLRTRIAEMKTKLEDLSQHKEDVFVPLRDKPMKQLSLPSPPGKPTEEIVLVHTDEDFDDNDFIPSGKPKK